VLTPGLDVVVAFGAAELELAGRRAGEAYERVKAAAGAYLRAQAELAAAAVEARAAGVEAGGRWAGWLQTPPERAVVEARAGDAWVGDRRVEEAVEAVVGVLREHGFQGLAGEEV